MKVKVSYSNGCCFVCQVNSKMVVTEESLRLEADLKRLESPRPNRFGGYNAPKMWVVNSIRDRIREAFHRGVAVPRRGMLKSYWAELAA